MALKSEFMAAGQSVAEASKSGFDTPNLAVAAAGGSQATATVLTSNFSLVKSGGAGGVIIREAHAPTVVSVDPGAGGTITVYPPLGGSINNSAANAGFTLAVGVTGIFIPAGLNWMAIRSA